MNAPNITEEPESGRDRFKETTNPSYKVISYTVHIFLLI